MLMLIMSQAEVLGLRIIPAGSGEGLVRRGRRRRLGAERGALSRILDDGGAVVLGEEGDLALAGVGLLLGLVGVFGV